MIFKFFEMNPEIHWVPQSIIDSDEEGEMPGLEAIPDTSQLQSADEFILNLFNTNQPVTSASLAHFHRPPESAGPEAMRVYMNHFRGDRPPLLTIDEMNDEREERGQARIPANSQERRILGRELHQRIADQESGYMSVISTPEGRTIDFTTELRPLSVPTNSGISRPLTNQETDRIALLVRNPSTRSRNIEMLRNSVNRAERSGMGNIAPQELERLRSMLHEAESIPSETQEETRARIGNIMQRASIDPSINISQLQESTGINLVGSSTPEIIDYMPPVSSTSFLRRNLIYSNTPERTTDSTYILDDVPDSELRERARNVRNILNAIPDPSPNLSMNRNNNSEIRLVRRLDDDPVLIEARASMRRLFSNNSEVSPEHINLFERVINEPRINNSVSPELSNNERFNMTLPPNSDQPTIAGTSRLGLDSEFASSFRESVLINGREGLTDTIINDNFQNVSHSHRRYTDESESEIRARWTENSNQDSTLRNENNNLLELSYSTLLSQLYGLPVTLPKFLILNDLKVDFIPFEEASQMLSQNKINKFIIEPMLQPWAGPPSISIEKLPTRIITMFGTNGMTYLVKAKYDQNSNQIFSPL